MTRARQWQLRQRAQGNCMACGKPAGGFSRCAEHRAWMREYYRKRRLLDIDSARSSERAKAKRLRDADPEKFKEASRRKYAANPEKMRRMAVESRSRNITKARARDKARRPQKTKQRRERMHQDPEFKIRTVLASRLGNALRRARAGKSAPTMELTGCDVPTLMNHLETRFKPGMSWQNHGRIWHVDHIRPCASFTLIEEVQQRACFHYSNLQPLFASENLSKGAKFTEGVPA